MAILLTLIFDLLMIALFLFRMVQGDQIIFIVSIILQGLIFIDLLAIILLRPAKSKNIESDPSEITRKRSRNQVSRPRGGLLAKVSCIIALLVLAYYIYSVVFLFI
ncbi:MAG: hypothetical protein RR439_05435 [Carnobacterium sp.]|uniref:DUF3899 domain-containing protein n=1 Tax=Enterococcus viikkiensis TaxID=930854 RepID=A0ABU3FT00_9ENTE|nr:hypothetical protein [Enterococcus viikkiensis]MDT2829099.1 hypothetical protein [Enterococcus viikkiensis]